MSIPVNYGTTGGESILNLYDSYAQTLQNAQKLKLEKQQQQWNQVKDALPLLMKVFQAIQANKQLEQMGVKTQVPEKKTFDEKSINEFMANMSRFSPQGQEQLRGMAQEGASYPTGRMKTEYDWSKLPAGTQYEDLFTGMTYQGQKPDSQMTEVPEGFEVAAYAADGRPLIRKIKEDKLPFTRGKIEQVKGALAAGKVFSGGMFVPLTTQQQKEEFAQSQLGPNWREYIGEDVGTNKKKPTKKEPETEIMDTNW